MRKYYVKVQVPPVPGITDTPHTAVLEIWAASMWSALALAHAMLPSNDNKLLGVAERPEDIL